MTAQFHTFSLSLDFLHNKQQFVMEISKKITIESKKLIFLLHRCSQQPLSSLSSDLDKKLDIIQSYLTQLNDQVQGYYAHQYKRFYQPGLEELIEALAFYHYLQHHSVIQKHELDLFFHDMPHIRVGVVDYLLGLLDFTGELMRYAIVILYKDFNESVYICQVLRDMDHYFSAMNNTSSLSKKIPTLHSSLRKVEQACYAFKVRGCEYPPNLFISTLSTDEK